ncbi:MAG: SpoIIE family protein phosphatase [Bryobacterales bacterium]
MPHAGQTRESLARERQRERRFEGDLERLIRRSEVLLVFLTIAAIAYGDWLTGRALSIGFLYLIPLSLCALTQGWRITLALVLLCVALRQLFGPIELSPTSYFVRDLALTAVFLSLVATMGRLSQRRRDFFESARRQRDELVDEVRMAAQVQENIIQRNDPPQTPYDIVARMEPARVVGGDYYDFLWHPDGTLGIVIADVAGKGLAAAMLMPAVDIAIQALGQRSSDPLRGARRTESRPLENTGARQLRNGAYAALEVDAGRLRYANGGATCPASSCALGRTLPEWLSARGTPIGLLPGARYELAGKRR